MNKNGTILIVDDEKDICDQISGLLNDNFFETFIANSSDDALKKMKMKNPNLILLDIWLNNSKLDGFKTLEKIKEFNEKIPVIMISGHGNIDTAVKSIKKGAFDFVEKPLDSELLIFKIKKAIENLNLKTRVNQLINNPFFKFVNNSDSSKKVFSLIKKISKTDSSILLVGPSGSGKDVLAKNIHFFSNRCKKNFKIINCLNLCKENFDEEILGKKYDNDISSEGVSEKIDGGTILLDQIEELSFMMQGKILGFLENQKLNKGGNTNFKNIDIRIIANSKLDLKYLIKKKIFREDLYNQLNFLTIKIPKLSERKEDLKELSEIFLNEFIERNNLKGKVFSKEIIKCFESLSFPGNVRQLRNIIEWILIMLSDDKTEIISYENLPQNIKNYFDNYSVEYNKTMIEDLSKYKLKEAKEIFEKNYLHFQINKFNKSISKTANFIGMDRTALYRKIKDLKIKTKN